MNVSLHVWLDVDVDADADADADANEDVTAQTDINIGLDTDMSSKCRYQCSCRRYILGSKGDSLDFSENSDSKGDSLAFLFKFVKMFNGIP